MRILFIDDIVGKPGHKVVSENVAAILAENRTDPRKTVSTIEVVDLSETGGKAGQTLFRSPALGVPCAPGSLSCITNYFHVRG